MKRTYLRATSDLVFHAYAYAREHGERIGDLAERVSVPRSFLQDILGRGKPLANSPRVRERIVALAKGTKFEGQIWEVVELRPVQ